MKTRTINTVCRELKKVLTASMNDELKIGKSDELWEKEKALTRELEILTGISDEPSSERVEATMKALGATQDNIDGCRWVLGNGWC